MEYKNCKYSQSSFLVKKIGKEYLYCIRFVNFRNDLISRRSFKNIDIYSIRFEIENYEYTLYRKYDNHLTLPNIADYNNYSYF